MIRVLIFVLLAALAPGAVLAQQVAWIQVEARPTLADAQARVRAYAGQLDDVAGYYIGSGWYGIVLGPYARDDAQALLSRLRAGGQIPSDSFLALGGNFQQQFWPVGVAAGTAPRPLPGASLEPAPGPEAESQPLAGLPQITLPDETPREARASERRLNRAEREALQVALKWAGFYQAAIDGAFGRGTRSAMEAWQIANNHPATGVMTTAQRAELLEAYDAVLDGMDLQLVRDDASGIQVKIPTGVVEFSAYAPPFVRFDPTGDVPGAQVLLISQAGDQTRMFGLYEILQTLEVVPPEGPRERRRGGFDIDGIGEDIRSHTMVRLRDGQIKGFMLVWPADDAARFSRVLAEMQDSFRAVAGVLDPAIAAPDEDQAVNLVAGLEVRKPRLSRSGFFIDRAGTVLTTTEAVDSCERLTINAAHDAEVTHLDSARGLAVLRPQASLAPISVAAFQTGVPRLQSQVAVAGYPYGGVLVTPALTFGRLADLRGLNGEEEIKRLALTAQPGDAGGPVFDDGGAVLGMLLPRQPLNGQMLPPEVSFSVDSEEILASLNAAGIPVETTDRLAFMAPETLTQRAAETTVLVSCW